MMLLVVVLLSGANLAGSYIVLGIEAFHLGQVELIGMNDPNEHLQMPASRMISCPNESNGNYHANTKSAACPFGYSQEETIKEIWEKL